MSGGGTPLDQLPEYNPADVVDDERAPAPRPQGRQFQGPSTEDMGYAEPRAGRGRRRGPPVGDAGSGDFSDVESWKDFLMREGRVPLVAAVLYFLLQLDMVDMYLLKWIPRLFTKDCEINTNGNLFKAALLGTLLLAVKYFVGI